MEKALKYELIQNIPELVDTIYPTNAPENIPKKLDGTPKPYLVYARINTQKIKTLQGFTNKQHLSYMFSIMAPKYSDMALIRKKVEELLMSIPQTTIGVDNTFVEDLDINNIDETWENELKVNRGIIDFTIYF